MQMRRFSIVAVVVLLALGLSACRKSPLSPSTETVAVAPAFVAPPQVSIPAEDVATTLGLRVGLSVSVTGFPANNSAVLYGCWSNDSNMPTVPCPRVIGSNTDEAGRANFGVTGPLGAPSGDYDYFIVVVVPGVPLIPQNSPPLSPFVNPSGIRYSVSSHVRFE